MVSSPSFLKSSARAGPTPFKYCIEVISQRDSGTAGRPGGTVLKSYLYSRKFETKLIMGKESPAPLPQKRAHILEFNLSGS